MPSAQRLSPGDEGPKALAPGMLLTAASMPDSWRSCEAVLRLVNQVCGDKQTLAGLFGAEVAEATWDDAAACWRVTLAVTDEGGSRTVFTFERKGPFEWKLVHIGLPAAEHMKAIAANFPDHDAFVCGPGPFMKGTVAALKELGMTPAAAISRWTISLKERVGCISANCLITMVPSEIPTKCDDSIFK